MKRFTISLPCEVGDASSDDATWPDIDTITFSCRGDAMPAMIEMSDGFDYSRSLRAAITQEQARVLLARIGVMLHHRDPSLSAIMPLTACGDMVSMFLDRSADLDILLEIMFNFDDPRGGIVIEVRETLVRDVLFPWLTDYCAGA